MRRMLVLMTLVACDPTNNSDNPDDSNSGTDEDPLQDDSQRYAGCVSESEEDSTGDGVANGRRWQTYDDQGRFLGYTYDSDLDGVSDVEYAVIWVGDVKERDEYRFNDQVNVTQYTYDGEDEIRAEYTIDGDPHWIRTYGYEDGHRRTGTYDFGSDGVVEQTMSYETDAERRILVAETRDNSGVLTSRIDWSYTDGRIQRMAADYDADGALDSDLLYEWSDWIDRYEDVVTGAVWTFTYDNMGRQTSYQYIDGSGELKGSASTVWDCPS